MDEICGEKLSFLRNKAFEKKWKNEKWKRRFLKVSDRQSKCAAKNEIWKTQNSYFSDFEPSCIANWNSNSPKNVFCGILRLFAVLKWICIWKVIKLRPNIGLIVGSSDSELGCSLERKWVEKKIHTPDRSRGRRMAFLIFFLGTVPKKFGTVPKNWERFLKFHRRKNRRMRFLKFGTVPKIWNGSQKRLNKIMKLNSLRASRMWRGGWESLVTQRRFLQITARSACIFTDNNFLLKGLECQPILTFSDHSFVLIKVSGNKSARYCGNLLFKKSKR